MKKKTKIVLLTSTAMIIPAVAISTSIYLSVKGRKNNKNNLYKDAAFFNSLLEQVKESYVNQPIVEDEIKNKINKAFINLKSEITIDDIQKSSIQIKDIVSEIDAKLNDFYQNFKNNSLTELTTLNQQLKIYNYSDLDSLINKTLEDLNNIANIEVFHLSINAAMNKIHYDNAHKNLEIIFSKVKKQIVSKTKDNLIQSITLNLNKLSAIDSTEYKTEIINLINELNVLSNNISNLSESSYSDINSTLIQLNIYKNELETKLVVKINEFLTKAEEEIKNNQEKLQKSIDALKIKLVEKINTYINQDFYAYFSDKESFSNLLDSVNNLESYTFESFRTLKGYEESLQNLGNLFENAKSEKLAKYSTITANIDSLKSKFNELKELINSLEASEQNSLLAKLNELNNELQSFISAINPFLISEQNLDVLTSLDQKYKLIYNEYLNIKNNSSNNSNNEQKEDLLSKLNQLKKLNMSFEFEFEKPFTQENLLDIENSINSESFNYKSILENINSLTNKFNELKDKELLLRQNKINQISNELNQYFLKIAGYDTQVKDMIISNDSLSNWVIKAESFKNLLNNLRNLINTTNKILNELRQIRELKSSLTNKYKELNDYFILLQTEHNQNKQKRDYFEQLKNSFNSNIAQLNNYLNDVKAIQTNNNAKKQELVASIESLINSYTSFNISEKTYIDNDGISTFINTHNLSQIESEINKFKTEVADENSHEITNDKNAPLSLAEVEKYYRDNPRINKFNSATTQPENKFNSNIDYLKLILRRSLSFLWNFKKIDESQPSNEINTIGGGTFWLLDYKRIENNKYKLFLGTNYHVATNLLNPSNPEEYKQPLKNSTINSLLISVNRLILDDNGYTYKHVSTFLPEKFWPKIFWLAHNFMNEGYGLPNNEFYFTDFAVVEWDIDLDEFMNWYNPEIATTPESIKKEKQRSEFLAMSVNKTIQTFNESKQRFSSGSYLNKDWNLPYANIDYYTTLWANNNLINNLNNPVDNEGKTNWTINNIENLSEYLKDWHLTNDKKYQSKPDFIHFAGYGLTNWNTLDTKVYSTVPSGQERSAESNYKGAPNNIFLIDHQYHGTIGNSTIKFNNTIPKQYGPWYIYYTDYRTVGGTSGSLVINQEGLPIGIYFGSGNRSIIWMNKNGENITLYEHSIVPFSIERSFFNEINGIQGYPFNLIDGSDKSRYPHQKMSFKEKLKQVYGSNYKTELFN
ncbi:MIP family Ig-specific serine endopeptidase [Mycoplasmopsis anatis]|uniref:MIP family Ig-specific serine endopeptidase n=1 Tax=Mycoplasmopsis anatis TaxID=171279 RepID=UPI001C4E1F56|nr:hypothetical protein [Mycoplasmopsis anatis]MBW0603097.1 hypothetical protein [Mycoplasmopsis anatis]